MKYDKLVRDNVPKIIEEKGEVTITHTASPEEYYKKLKDKLKEEVTEFLREGKVEELADILEVVYVLGKYQGINEENLESMRQKKRVERRGFEKRIILDEVK